MYADPTQLGWDPTMERVSTRHHVGQVDYIIKFRDVRYRTVRLISDIGAEAIRGRGTRVWEVRQLNKNDEEDPTPLVLKDSWVDADREREGHILATIRETAQGLSNVYDFDKYFMKAKDYGDVYIEDKLDHTYGLIRKRSSPVGSEHKPLVIKTKAPVPAKGPHIPSNAAGVTGAPQLPGDDDDGQNSVKYSAKIHHRIVFTEVGTTVAEVSSLSDAVFAMADVTRGKHIAFRAVSPYLIKP